MPVPKAPVLGEPLPIELANTRFGRRRDVVDGLESPAALAAWLGDVRHRFGVPLDQDDLEAVDAPRLRTARALRDALRTLLGAAAARAEPDAAAVEVLNATVRSAPRWHELAVGTDVIRTTRTAASPIDAALAEIAERGVELLATPGACELRACPAPGCLLFFCRDHPRGAFCSPRCSARVRAARHYAHRGGERQGPVD